MITALAGIRNEAKNNYDDIMVYNDYHYQEHYLLIDMTGPVECVCIFAFAFT